MIGDDNSVTGGLIGAFSLCAINYIVVRFLFRHHRLDQWIEGKRAVLIKDGKIRPRPWPGSSSAASELQTIVHRQGFASLDEIESCVLETGGTFSIEPKLPRQSARDQASVLARLDDLARQIDELKQLLRPRDRSQAGDRSLRSGPVATRSKSARLHLSAGISADRDLGRVDPRAAQVDKARGVRPRPAFGRRMCWTRRPDPSSWIDFEQGEDGEGSSHPSEDRQDEHLQGCVRSHASLFFKKGVQFLSRISVAVVPRSTV